MGCRIVAMLAAMILTIRIMSTVFSPTGLMSFKEFIALKPDDKAYELHEG
jgi:amino acid permease